MGGSTQNEPEKFAELAARYELDFDPDSIPGLVQRFDLRFPGDPVWPASRIVSRRRPTNRLASSRRRERKGNAHRRSRPGRCRAAPRGPASPLVRRHPIVAADGVACWEVGKLVEGGARSTGKRRCGPRLQGVPSGSSWRSAATSGIVSPRMSVRREITSSSSSPKLRRDKLGVLAAGRPWPVRGQLDGEGSETRGLQIRRQPLEAPLSVPGTVDQAEGGHCGGATSVAADRLLRDPQGSVERRFWRRPGRSQGSSRRGLLPAPALEHSTPRPARLNSRWSVPASPSSRTQRTVTPPVRAAARISSSTPDAAPVRAIAARSARRGRPRRCHRRSAGPALLLPLHPADKALAPRWFAVWVKARSSAPVDASQMSQPGFRSRRLAASGHQDADPEALSFAPGPSGPLSTWPHNDLKAAPGPSSSPTTLRDRPLPGTRNSSTATARPALELLAT